MEDIKSNLDNLLAKMNESVTNSAPKKLNFEHINDSLDGPATTSPCKKRRHSESSEETLEISKNESSISTDSSWCTITMSPWESRRVKADLIEAKIRINKLKQEMDRMQKLHQESEILLMNRVSEVKKQCEFSTSKAQDLEKHLQVVRVRERQTKQQLTKVQRELQKQKHDSEEVIMNLKRANQDMEENARMVQTDLVRQLNECKSHAEKITSELALNALELDTLKQQLMEYKIKASAFDELQSSHAQMEQDLNMSNSRVKELEFEIASYKDWKEITKDSQNVLLNVPNTEKELVRLRSNNRRLQDLLGNKLLLEEKVLNLQSRLDKEDSARSELATLQVHLKYAQDELKEWMKIAEDHCQPNTLVSPLALRARIEELLRNDIVMINEKANKNSENKIVESELLNYKQKCEVFEKNIEELNVALKRHKALKERIQRKLLLISKERDCYKQLLDNFEKDLTITNTTTSETNTMELQMKCRIEMLEKMLSNYKELCGTLEKELSTVKTINNNDSCGSEQTVENKISIDSTAGYDHMKKELNTLRLENERLYTRKQELELELEHYHLKNSFHTEKRKVIHMIQNPAAEAYQLSDNVIEKLQAEIERLKHKNKQLEEDSEVTQMRLNDTTSMTVNIKEMNLLRTEIESLNSKMRKMKEYYKVATTELRDIMYMLLGYRIDRINSNKNFKVTSMFAESPEDYLNFRLNESNAIEMLETPYSVSLKPLIEAHLESTKSLPAFLSALTLELFQRATITIS